MTDKEFVSNNQEKLSGNTTDSDEEDFLDENLWSYKKLTEIPKDKDLLKKKVYKYHNLHCLCQRNPYISYMDKISYKMRGISSSEGVWNLKFTPEEATMIFDGAIRFEWIDSLLAPNPLPDKIIDAFYKVSSKYSAKIEFDNHGKVISLAEPLELFTKDVTILEIAIIIDKLMAEEILSVEAKNK